MKILVVSQYYYPEQFRITDICEELVQRGHSVTVLTGLPCYNMPQGEIPEEYQTGHDSEKIRGVSVLRVHQRARKTGALNRFLNYYSFAKKASKAAKKLQDDFDVIYVYETSPVMQGEAAIAYKKKYGAPILFYCMDLWPASLTIGGIKEGSSVYRHYHKVSKRIYGSSDIIAVTSENFVQYFIDEFGFERKKLVYLPQYSEDMFDVVSCKKQPNEEIDLLFAGNVGVAQSVQTIIRAAAELKEVKNLHWHIVGEGTELENCKKLAAQLNVESVIFYGKRPLSEMPKFYSIADAMLVTLNKNEVISRTLPGKVQTYMAAGKPIIGAIDGETQAVIQKADCGYCGEAENVEALKNNVLSFIACENKQQLGLNARDYYNLHFCKEKYFSDLERLLSELVGR